MQQNTPAIFVSLLGIVLVVPASALAAPSLQAQGQFSGSGSDTYLGYSVAIDGDTAVVGAWNDNATNGAAYVYVRSGTTWSLQKQLTATDGAADDEFGYTVALSGNTALIGATGKGNGQGWVYAFTRSGSAWSQQQEFTEPSGGAADDCFGCALAVSGATAVIGAAGVASNVGETYVFVNSGGTWQTQGQGFLGAAQGNYFGFSVALNPTGDVAVVGAFGVPSGSLTEAGMAYVFARSGTTWTQQSALTAPDPSMGARFGYAVAVGTGTAIVGAYGAGGPGAAYVFSQSGTSWTEQTKLVPPDPAGDDLYGASVALAGNTALVGAYERGGALGPGAAYLYTNSGSGWSQPPQELFAPSAGQDFGYSVALSGGSAVIGAIASSNHAGTAYFFGPAVTAAAPALGGPQRIAALTLLLVAVGTLASRRRHAGRTS
jgi:FG-GAP repeat